MTAIVTANIDLKHERITRWALLVILGLLALQSALVLPNIPDEPYTVSFKVFSWVLIGLFSAQCAFMALYHRLDRKGRSIGMVIDYILLVLSLPYITMYFFFMFAESVRPKP